MDDKSVELTPKWTQSEAVAFECAREVITEMHAIFTGQIADESSKPQPDAERLASLSAERTRLFQERSRLRVKDHAQIARIRTEYGALVRACRTSNLSAINELLLDEAWLNFPGPDPDSSR